MPKFETIVDLIVTESCIDLFSAYGHRVKSYGKTYESVNQFDGLAGVIAFYGKDMRGTLTLHVKEDVLKKTGPDREKKDWVCELSNQLLGRFRRKLRSFKVELRSSTPMAILGRHLKQTVKSGRLLLHWEFALEANTPNIKILLSADSFSNAIFEDYEEKQEVTEEIAEGDLIIF